MDAKDYKQIETLLKDSLRNLQKLANEDIADNIGVSYYSIGFVACDIQKALEILENGY